tara:strand:- start:927 stop:1076 length:150 start_codon:yes stop_codon:yes gene_type:complete
MRLTVTRISPLTKAKARQLWLINKNKKKKKKKPKNKKAVNKKKIRTIGS